MLICFVLEWKIGLCVKAIDLWLLLFSGITIGSASFDSPTVTSLSPTRLNTRFFWMACTLALCSETLMKACCWSGCRKPSSVSSNHNHVASFAANVKAMYLASVDDRATVACFLEHQLTGPLFNMKMKPEIDLRLSLSPAQLGSE